MNAHITETSVNAALVYEELKNKGTPIKRVFENAVFIDKGILSMLGDPDYLLKTLSTTTQGDHYYHVYQQDYDCFTLVHIEKDDDNPIVFLHDHEDTRPPVEREGPVFVTSVTNHAIVRDFLTGRNEQVVPVLSIFIKWLFASTNLRESLILKNVVDAIHDITLDNNIALPVVKDTCGLIEHEIESIKRKSVQVYRSLVTAPGWLMTLLEKFQLSLQRNSEVNGYFVNERITVYKTNNKQYIFGCGNRQITFKPIATIDGLPESNTSQPVKENTIMEKEENSLSIRAKKIRELFDRKVQGKHRDGGILTEILSDFATNDNFEKELETHGVYIDCRHDSDDGIREVFAYILDANTMYSQARFEYNGQIEKLYQ